MIKTYYNPDDGCWWAYVVDSEGNQVGDAEPAPTQKLAKKYIKMFLKATENNSKKVLTLNTV